MHDESQDAFCSTPDVSGPKVVACGGFSPDKNESDGREISTPPKQKRAISSGPRDRVVASQRG